MAVGCCHLTAPAQQLPWERREAAACGHDIAHLAHTSLGTCPVVQAIKRLHREVEDVQASVTQAARQFTGE